MQQFLNLPPVEKGDCEELEKRIDIFYKTCTEENIFPTVELLSCALCVSRQTVWHWSNENTKFGRMVLQAKNLVNAAMTQSALNGKTAFPFVIWLQKNGFGYKESTELEIKNTEDEKNLLEAKDLFGLLDDIKNYDGGNDEQ